MSSLTVDATFIGHDLNRGTSQFTKTPRPEQAAPAQPTSADSEAAGDERSAA